MLELHSPGLFGRTIRVTSNGHEIATITDKWMRTHITIEGVQYEMTRAGLVSGDFLLKRGGEVIARGRKPSFASRRMQAELQGWVYDLVPQSSFTSKFRVEHQGTVVGHIGPRPVWRTFTAALPPTMHVVYQVFLIALVALMWARADD